MTIDPASAPPSDSLPLDPSTGDPRPPQAQPGYYPGFSTLSQQAFWDEATRAVILQRVHHLPPIRFFTPDERALMEALVARLVPQDDRDEAHRVPLVNTIDERLFTGRIDGYRFEDMPPDTEAYRLGLSGIDAIAHHLHRRRFVDLTATEQDEVLWTLHRGEPPAGEDVWERVAVARFWLLITQDAIEAYYAHPFAWDEIGFGGPAYPRGYFRLEHGRPEPWEVKEQRYEWDAPADSRSDRYEQLGGPGTHHTPAGQEGSH
jgi:hypothetical protein